MVETGQSKKEENNRNNIKEDGQDGQDSWRCYVDDRGGRKGRISAKADIADDAGMENPIDVCVVSHPKPIRLDAGNVRKWS